MKKARAQDLKERMKALGIDVEHYWYENLVEIVLVAFFSAIFVGSIFYMVVDGWPYPTAFYYAVQALLGVGFGVPSESSDISYIFSSFYLMFGGTMMVGAVGSMLTTLTSARKTLVVVEEYVPWYATRLAMVRLLFLAWIALGTVYAYNFEGFDPIMSLYWAVSAMSTCGMIPPTCTGGDEYTCTLGYRGYFVGLYIMVGVPLYGLCMGQLAGLILEGSLKKLEQKKALEPLCHEEFRAVANFMDDEVDENIDLTEFVVLDLIRKNKLDVSTLNDIKKLFNWMDADKSGFLTIDELLKGGLLEISDERYQLDLNRR